MGKSLWHRIIHPVTGYFRKRRGKFLLNQFPGIREFRIGDVGGSMHFWEKLELDISGKNITIYNISRNEAAKVSGDIDREINFQIFDGVVLPVGDNYFDLIVCNSVLEHVPVQQRVKLAKEMIRTAKNIFCQTPAASSPIEFHFIMPFIHWLPKKWGYYLVFISPWRIISRPSRAVIDEYFWGTNLLKEDELRKLFLNCTIHYERLLGVVKSYYVIIRKRI